MPGVYPQVRAVLDRTIEELDALLQGITDDQLHRLVNLTSKDAATARLRIDQIDQARQRPGR